jgi:hypothetical protein
LPRHPSRSSSAAAALVAACVAGWLVYQDVPPATGGDFAFYRNGALALLGGYSPYSTGFYYPMPSAMLLTPLAYLTAHVGVTVFMGIGVGLMVFALLRAFGWPSLVILLSPAFWDALYKLQWGPVLVAAALLPYAGFLASGKATIGLASLVYKPNKWALGGYGAMFLLSFALRPHWLTEWRGNLGVPPAPHTPPLLWIGGALGLLGALRWRTPQGRVLLACTLIPASAQLYDHLLLWLVPRDWRQSLVLTTCAWTGYIALLATVPHDLTKDATAAQFSIAMSVYVPAAVMLLLRNAVEPSDPRRDVSPRHQEAEGVGGSD